MRNPFPSVVTPVTRRGLVRAALLLVTTTLVACGAVYSDGPVGNVPIELDPQRWDGVWVGSPAGAGSCVAPGQGATGVGSGDCFVLTVVDAKAGVLNVTSGDGTQQTAWLRTVRPVVPDAPGDAEPGGRVAARPQQRQPYPMLVTLEGPDDAGTTRWQLTGWAALRGEVLLVWTADAVAFRALISDGALPADLAATRTSSEDAHLGPLDDRALAVLTGPRRWDLFEWDDPLVLYRLPAGSPACGEW